MKKMALAFVCLLVLLPYGNTQSSSSSPTPTVTPTDDTNDLFNQLKYIYIIAGVILFLIVIVIVLLAAVCIIWHRRSSNNSEPERTKRQSAETGGQQSTEAQVPTSITPSPSPQKKTYNAKVRGHGHKKPTESVMSDFPLLCRVLEDYQSPQHHLQQTSPNESFSSNYRIRVSSEVSSDIDASIRTTTSYVSESADYDELDNVVNVIKAEGSSSPKSPLKSASKLSKPIPLSSTKPLGSVEEEPQESVDAFGYHQITIKKENENVLTKSQSTIDMFDDPKYEQLPQAMSIDSHSFNGNLQAASSTPQLHTLTDHNASQLHSMPLSETSFDKKDLKQYMSLDQVLQLVETRLRSSSREASVEMDQIEESEGLYCPRVLRPVINENKN